MENVYLVTSSNDYCGGESGSWIFAKKADADKFIKELIDGLVGSGYSEDEMTKDREQLWFFNYGNSQTVITLDKKEIK